MNVCKTVPCSPVHWCMAVTVHLPSTRHGTLVNDGVSVYFHDLWSTLKCL